MENNNRSAVLNQINALDFAMTDLNLYLDTHPHCTEALNLFKEYRTQRAEKIAEYERCFGPYTVTANETAGDCWNWIDSPWPWEC